MSLGINLARRVAYGVPESAESGALDEHHCRCSTWSAKGCHCPAGSRCSMRMRQPGPSFRNGVERAVRVFEDQLDRVAFPVPVAERLGPAAAEDIEPVRHVAVAQVVAAQVDMCQV